VGSTSRYGRATINPTAPEAVGVCDRCGFLYNLRNLRFQFDWAGTGMINKQLRVCSRCYDDPQEQLRAITLPPDPMPVWQPRPEPYEVDEINHYTLRGVVGPGFLMFRNSLLSMAVDFEVSGVTFALNRRMASSRRPVVGTRVLPGTAGALWRRMVAAVYQPGSG
jgi:hypothetical protein